MENKSSKTCYKCEGRKRVEKEVEIETRSKVVNVKFQVVCSECKGLGKVDWVKNILRRSND